MNEIVPMIEDLKDLYPQDALKSQKARFEHLKIRFSELHGRLLLFVTRSPGRVNLIGEHIDYSLYKVLPIAITADVFIAIFPVPRNS